MNYNALKSKESSKMTIEPYICELDSDTKTTLKVYLYRNVLNVEVIRESIIKGEWNCAIIKPSLVVDMFQVAVAANKAVVAKTQQSMVTRTVFAEILFNLSLSKNISQSLSKFGIEHDTDLLICFLHIGTTNIEYEQYILSHIKGTPCPISELSSLTNLTDVKQVYKLNNLTSHDNLLDVIVSKMVTKNFVAY